MAGCILRIPGVEHRLGHRLGRYSTYRQHDTALVREDPARARSVDAQGNPLVFWVQAGSMRAPELLELLARLGADLNARDRSDRTALDAALANGHDQLADELRRHGGRASRELPPP